MSYEFNVYNGSYVDRPSCGISDSLPSSGFAWVYIPSSIAFTYKPFGVGNAAASLTDFIETNINTDGSFATIIKRGGWTQWVQSSAGLISTDSWHHIGWTINSDATLFFVAVDGYAYMTTYGGILTSASANYDRTVYGGAIVPGGAGVGLIGYLGEVAIYNAYLEWLDFQALYDGKSPLDVRRANLKSYSPLVGNYNELIGGGTWTEYGTPTPAVQPHCKTTPKILASRRVLGQSGIVLSASQVNSNINLSWTLP
jgi:hypothetical protein